MLGLAVFAGDDGGLDGGYLQAVQARNIHRAVLLVTERIAAALGHGARSELQHDGPVFLGDG